MLSGEVRVQHGDEVVEAVPGSFAFTPAASVIRSTSTPMRRGLLLFFGPAGVEGFFRDVATRARWFGLPPPDEPLKDREAVVEIISRYGQTVLGPPLGPKG